MDYAEVAALMTRAMSDPYRLADILIQSADDDDAKARLIAECDITADEAAIILDQQLRLIIGSHREELRLAATNTER
ncbi:MAG: hypothetical protein QOK10_3346 [Pseudonocardiales bacterium]|jgi:hypothetical protein|nr:hypothetical protein [Pseudonocardiales bacterium]